MTEAAKLEARLLTASELELVASSREPEIERLSDDELKAAARRLREAANRAQGIAARQSARFAARPPRVAQGPRRTTLERSARRRLCARRSSGSRPNSAGAPRRR